jgi:hypothetical protein
MPLSSSTMSIDAVRSQIHSIEDARPEGKTGTEAGSKILNTKPANYSKKK